MLGMPVTPARPARLRQSAAATKQPQPFDWFDLAGQSIVARLQNSSFGLFTACIADIKSYLPGVHFKLPQVIVVGGKSAGKSSLLEMITKCPVFPRHTDFCTKVPIRLQLKRVESADQSAVTVEFRGLIRNMELEDILTEVDKIMKQVDNVSDDPIVIRILKVMVFFSKHSAQIESPGDIVYNLCTNYVQACVGMLAGHSCRACCFASSEHLDACYDLSTFAKS